MYKKDGEGGKREGGKRENPNNTLVLILFNFSAGG